MKNKNRFISSLFFTLFCLLLCLSLRMPVMQMSLTNMPVVVLVELAFLFLFGAVTVKAFASREPFVCGQKAQLCALAGLYLAFDLITIEMQTSIIAASLSSIIAASLSSFNQALATNVALCWCLFGLRFVLLAVALVFACQEEKQATIVFEEGADPLELQSEEAMEALTEQLDEAEALPQA